MVKLYLRGSLWFVAAQCFLLAAAHAQCTRNCGINPDSFRLLYQFTGSPDGAAPVVELLKDAAGNFYGTTSAGGNPTTCPSEGGCGTVFKLDSAGNETVLYEFTGAPDGATPQSPLVQDTAGNLYGTTSSGGASTFGTVFKIDTAGKETMLYSFGGPPDGEFPAGRLVLDAAGNLYGSTQNGGVSGDGTVFRLDTTGKETVLYSFTDRRPQGL